MSTNNYQSTLEYLYRQLPMYQRVGARAFKKDLTNILALMDLMGRPHEQFKTIHIAGTNGKGSTAHMLSAILQVRGYKTGLYTSPHYRDFRERIKINGRYIPRTEVVRFVEKYREGFEPIQPSYFELTVAMAFEYFARAEVDIAVIETGLGGRLDSTNIITPLLSIITNISYDHQAFLGDTLPLIAGEKAGIIKPGVPVVIGETHPETAPVFIRTAADRKSSIVFADRHYRAQETARDWTGASYDIFRDDRREIMGLRTDLIGPYQYRNLQTVLQSMEVFAGLMPVSREAILEGLSSVRSRTRFIGRWQVLGERPLIIADSAHNEGGIRFVSDALSRTPHQSLHIVLGVVNDKDLAEILPLFPASARYYFARPDVPRGLDAGELREQAAAFGLRGRTYKSVRYALRAAKRHAAAEDLIFVGGSTFVVAEVV